MTDLLPSTGEPTDRPHSESDRLRSTGRQPKPDTGRRDDAGRARHVGADRRSALRARVRRRRRRDPADGRRGARRPQDPARRRRPRRPHRAADDRGTAGPARRLARRTRSRPATDGTLQIEINNIQQAPAHRARPRPGSARQPHHRRGDRSGRLRSDHDGQQRRRAADQGRPPRRRRGRASAHPRRPPRSGRSGGPRSRPPTRSIDCLYAAGAIAADAVLDRRADRARARTSSPCCGRARSRRSSRRVGDEFVLLSHSRARGVGPAAAQQGTAVRARTAARPRHRGRSPSTAGPARARRSWRSPPASSRSSSSTATSAWPCTGRSCPSVGPTSASCPAGSTRSSTRGWRRSTMPSSRSPTAGSSHDARDLVDELTDRGQLSLESVTFLRGRSLQRQFVVIDEAQNLEPTTLRTILTRVGDGTKVDLHRRHEPDRRAVPRRVEQRPQPCSPRRSPASTASGTSRSPPASAATSPASPPNCCNGSRLVRSGSVRDRGRCLRVADAPPV